MFPAEPPATPSAPDREPAPTGRRRRLRPSSRTHGSPPPTSTFDAPGALPYSLARARTHTLLMDRAPCTSHRLQTRVAISGGRLALAGRLRFLPHQHRQQRRESSSCFRVSSLPGAYLLLPAGLCVGSRNNKVWRRLWSLLSLVVIKARQGLVESSASPC